MRLHIGAILGMSSSALAEGEVICARHGGKGSTHTSWIWFCRRCPGSHLIESSMWIVITSFLATFDVKKAVDERGKVIEPDVVFENAVFRCVLHTARMVHSGSLIHPPLTRTPNTFPCDIQPRSARAVALIHEQSASN